ncbi:alpha/beta fold hydrolase family protein [Natronococcus wangiae]|uniref:alpha/beta hydrolase n=1 Tax=Natronococcus wangiae TaxID=3068275 RepID=UPI00273D2643|nr:alpha/beta hydrolase [Natronococcus sp. AD5]
MTVGAVGVTAVSGAASAGEAKDCGNWPDSPREYPTVDLTQERPDPLGLEAGEICVYAHGWNGMESSHDQTYALDLALREEDYDETTVTARWDSDTANFWAAESNADEAGVRLGRWLRAEYEDDSSTTIRLVGHSLGGRLLLNTLDELAGDVVVDTASLLGAAVEDGSVCEGGRFADGIRESAADVYNYHSRDDDTVCVIYEFSTVESGLGCAGADCDGWFSDGSTPDAYADVDVTESVPGHCEYFRHDRSAGCADRIVDDFES